jgi:chromosome segregation protein
MPSLKKIELKGFKTFGKPTSILLEKGFTAITGPNGSGKTNVMDAVLFALGELSSRRLRAENFGKLVFHGSPEAGLEKAKGAKVVMQFDNSDGRMPVDTATVTISREVYRNGQSVYRLNGRRISRANLVDTLSMVGISPSGHNVVVQGTITKMAEIAPSERRKIIDDMVGIAQYDAEKAEAEDKLRQADIQIKTATGRIDEVQKRVDDLERERNQLLRFNFISGETKRFEAMKISYDMGEIQNKIADLSTKIQDAQSHVDKLKLLRDEQRGQRHQIEKEWRKVSSEGVEEGGTKILEVQIKTGDAKARLTELTTKIGASSASLEGLRKVKENSLQQLQAINNEVDENRKNVGQFKREYNRLTKEAIAKQAQHDALVKETGELWASLGENSKRIREIEQRLDKLSQNLVSLRSAFAESQTTMRMLIRRLEDHTARKQRFATNLSELNKSIADLNQVQNEQKTRLKSLQQTLERRITQKDSVEHEISDAGKIADSAREAVVEFATQRELAETVASQEVALRSIEEMGELGVIPGVLGRLRTLIKTERGAESPVEAAAAGWLDSIVVKDIDTAFACSETLRRLKLGRIKLIPLKEMMDVKPVRQPRIDGVGGAASQLVKYSKQYEPAVTYVLGDTLIAKDDKAALAASKEGFRSVTMNGDLYEAGGALEGGYYRAPIDFSALIPRENAIKSLEDAVRTLREHLTKRGGDIAGLQEEMDKTREEIARLTEASVTLENEIKRLKRSSKTTARNVRRIEWNISAVHSRLEKKKTEIGVQKGQRDAINKEMQKLRGELAGLRRKVDPSHIQELEVQRGKLAEELVEKRQRLSGVESSYNTAQAKLNNVLKIGYANAQIQLKRVERQLTVLEQEAKAAIEEKITLENELKQLEATKEELTRSVLSARKESQKFTDEIDDIDKQLQRLDSEYEHADRLLNQLQLSSQTLQLQLDQHRARLTEFGYDEPLAVAPEQVEATQSALRLMRLELDRLGAVNQLALAHYNEQIGRYRELSIRMNELEKEKQSIIAFMDEIDRKKRQVFMEAFHKVNDNFSKYFLKLTDGGEASLKLENPEEPFSGGVDMIVQFPGKPPILVNGASSGERSVTAVAFLFAIQDFMPAAFYLFDEVDAHLDAFHVAKLGELLVEESRRSQFIVITLKPEMANKAERVYGIYEHKGVSHVVSPTFKKEAA